MTHHEQELLNQPRKDFEGVERVILPIDWPIREEGDDE